MQLVKSFPDRCNLPESDFMERRGKQSRPLAITDVQHVVNPVSSAEQKALYHDLYLLHTFC